MATVLPPLSKKRRLAESANARKQQEVPVIPDNPPNVVINLRAADTGSQLGGELHVPGDATTQQLDQLVNKLLGTVYLSNEHDHHDVLQKAD